MSTSIIESIAQNVLATVNGVTIAAGYHQTLTGVRPARLPNADDAHDNNTVVLVQGNPRLDADNSGMGNAAMLAWRQPFALIAYVIASDTETASLDARINEVRSDIEKALMADRKRGGFAIDTQITEPEFFDYDAAVTGIIVMAEILYRTRENDPFTAA